LKSPDPYVRYTAMYLLGTLGEAARDAAPAIEKILEERDEFGHAVAAWALVSIDSNPENIRRAIPLMIKALEHESPLVRAKAAEMLGKIGRDNPDVQAALQKATRDQEETVRQAAEKALAGRN
jgi:HEAT repeat protein